MERRIAYVVHHIPRHLLRKAHLRIQLLQIPQALTGGIQLISSPGDQHRHADKRDRLRRNRGKARCSNSLRPADQTAAESFCRSLALVGSYFLPMSGGFVPFNGLLLTIDLSALLVEGFLLRPDRFPVSRHLVAQDIRYGLNAQGGGQEAGESGVEGAVSEGEKIDGDEGEEEKGDEQAFQPGQ